MRILEISIPSIPVAYSQPVIYIKRSGGELHTCAAQSIRLPQNPLCGGSLDKLKKKGCDHTGGTDTKEQLLNGKHKRGIMAKSLHDTAKISPDNGTKPEARAHFT